MLPVNRSGGKGASKGGKGATGAKGRNDYAELEGSNRGFMGPSLVEQAAAASAARRRGGRQRVELYIGPNDDRLRRAAAETLVNSIAPNTRKTYGDNLKFFLGFSSCHQYWMDRINVAKKPGSLSMSCMSMRYTETSTARSKSSCMLSKRLQWTKASQILWKINQL